MVSNRKLPLHAPGLYSRLRGLRRLVRGAVTNTLGRRTADESTTASVPPPEAFPLRERRVRFAGRTLRVLVREGTIDSDLVDMILRPDSEYRLPDMVEPGTIFDVGANIGITALYFAVRYPRARVFCFEPLPENFALLCENVKRNDLHVHAIPCGLSDRNGVMEYYYSADPRNFGGGGFHLRGTNPARGLTVDVATTTKMMHDLGLDRIDLFKIDTEGHEMAIVRGMPESVLRNAQALIGELHGECDWQFCDTLTPSHAVGVQKRYSAPCFPFIAVRKDLVARNGVRQAA